MHRYEIILYWSNEDQAFIAEAPELPGCMAHGDDQETALEKSRTRCNSGSTPPENWDDRFQSRRVSA